MNCELQMWLDPLAARTDHPNAYTAVITVADAAGVDVARVVCPYNREAACAMFGAIELLDPAGAPRQRVRAMVLLTRQAARTGHELGIRRVVAEALDDRLATFAAAVSGMRGTPDTFGRTQLAGELVDVRSWNLQHTDDLGRIDGAG